MTLKLYLTHLSDSDIDWCRVVHADTPREAAKVVAQLCEDGLPDDGDGWSCVLLQLEHPGTAAGVLETVAGPFECVIVRRADTVVVEDFAEPP